MNQYNVIYIDFSDMDDAYTDYGSFICRIKRQLKKDLEASYPEISFDEDSTISEDLGVINQKTRDRFIFILDKRDIVFNLIFFDTHQRQCLLFPKALLKDRAYADLTYMT